MDDSGGSSSSNKYANVSPESDDAEAEARSGLAPPPYEDSEPRSEPVEDDEEAKKELTGPAPKVTVPVVLRKEKQPERERSFVPPRANCQEKIILCIDVSMEMNQLPFVTLDGVKRSPLSMIRRVVDFFIHTKSRIDVRHEYALVLLQEDAVWLKDFVSDPKDLLDAVNDIQDTYECDTMNFTSLLDLICEKVMLPTVENHTMPPPYTVRVIMLYTRSFCVPEIDVLRESHKQLRSSEYFFFDVFYIHLPPTDENCCQEIYDFFCKLDERGTYYILEEVRNISRLHNYMAKFLAHPLQRTVPQPDDSAYNLVTQFSRYPNE